MISKTSRKMPPSSEVTKCKKQQKLTMLPSDQDVEAYNLSFSSPSFVRSSLVTPTLSQPPTIKESTPNTPSALFALSLNFDQLPFDAHTTVFNSIYWHTIIGLKIL
jgi:hypothetical protein